MFKKALIANRGEIACRILRTLRRLGIRSVAVYSEADRFARHVLDADEAVCIGPAAAKDSYLNASAVLDAAHRTHADAIHPGYGFLSEDADFAAATERAGLAYVGPTAKQIRAFGLKHEARAIATRNGIPLLPGSDLIATHEAARAAVESIGLPVMLKSTAGGGGIGMQICRDLCHLPDQLASVQALAQRNFGNAGLFIERYVEHARHVEVQIFGDGNGKVVTLGTRDCSAQRRHQKVIEETPAPGLSPELLTDLIGSAQRLGEATRYRSAGTVEFLVDAHANQFYFLEVNTRLQVEHGITELIYGIDLVEWMLRVAAGEELSLDVPTPSGCAMQARLYAEDPARQFRPNAGLLTEVSFPDGVRVDTAVERGSEVTAHYDPLLAKVLVHAATREATLERLTEALRAVRLGGIETNLEYLIAIATDEAMRRAAVDTSMLSRLAFEGDSIEVIVPGTMTTVQDYPGRLGYWDVGIPPSGPMDDLNFRLANRVVGNLPGVPALEITASGPTLSFALDGVVAITGADFEAMLDGKRVPRYEPIQVRRGQVLKLTGVAGHGWRGYLAIRHGFEVPSYLDSCATFTLGGFGGHAGRALRAGDILHVAHAGGVSSNPSTIAASEWPELTDHWKLGVIAGPHAAPDFFTQDDIELFYATDWRVHYNSARTGVRLIGPKPKWARPDGGDAGLHPSNLHDNAYAVGTVDFTGDMPILLGPDGPSLGGFVCPATVIAAERWKLGQLKPDALVRFEPRSQQSAALARALQSRWVEELTRPPEPSRVEGVEPVGRAVLRELPKTPTRPQVAYRPCGDEYLLVEYGPMTLDLALRFRVHALMQRVRSERRRAIIDLTPGIRSLQIHYDPSALPLGTALEWLQRLEDELPPVEDLRIQSRIVNLPLSWDDPQSRLAIDRYTQGVRPDAPWAPSNIEFIRRINGLADEDAVRRIVFDANYLVLGLGDVYLGAPVATPIDPRQRLVTTKYNPARTWTPENAVGIGGAYLCIYGMEGPGGYQLVGRTLQMFNRWKSTPDFPADRPWLLQFFDQIRFYPVSAQELLEMRAAFPHGKLELDITETTFDFAEHLAQLERDRSSIAEFRSSQRAAFEAERQRWKDAPEFLPAELDDAKSQHPVARSDGADTLQSHVHGCVWKVNVGKGSKVRKGDVVLVVESMKAELEIQSPVDGIVNELLIDAGQAVSPGRPLLAILRDSGEPMLT